MPKKEKGKKAMARQPKHTVLEQENDDIENMMMDEEKRNDMKEKLFAEMPEFRNVFSNFEKVNKDRTAQAQDSSVVFTNRRGMVTEELLLQFPHSPTAKETMVAFNHYKFAFNVLWRYNRPRVLTNYDCDFLQPGLHHYMEGYMIAQYMSQQFPPPPPFKDWIEDYLKLRPHDSLVEYLYVNIAMEITAKTKSDYEGCKDTIRARELFVHKMLPFKDVETEKHILINSYYMLGAKYTSTDQYERALEAFEKCYDLDETNLGALYAIAFHNKSKDPDKALELSNKYLDQAPKCDEKYPNIHYLIGFLYATHFKNLKLAKKYYELGQKAETYKLPFNPPTDFAIKYLLETLVPFADRKLQTHQKELEFLDLD